MHAKFRGGVIPEVSGCQGFMGGRVSECKGFLGARGFEVPEVSGCQGFMGARGLWVPGFSCRNRSYKPTARVALPGFRVLELCVVWDRGIE